MTELLTLVDAAERLGVHYMTAYRYVRTGRLLAHKVSGQWQVDENDLASFVEGSATPAPRRERLPQLIEERLIAGDENGSHKLLEDAMASGAGVEEVYIDLLSPAMIRVGLHWQRGEISIADEHVATSTASRVISRLGSRVSSRGRTRGTILLATISKDFHSLPTAILRDLLRSRGFDVQDLGANMPSASIVERASQFSDLLAIGLSATSLGHDDVTREALATFEQLDAPIVVGGSAFEGPEHIQSLGRCFPSTSAREALSIFESIHADARATAR